MSQPTVHPDIPRRTKTRARKTVLRIEKMAAEWQEWKGEPMTRVRVKMTDYLALKECNFLDDGKLSGTTIEVLPG